MSMSIMTILMIVLMIVIIGFRIGEFTRRLVALPDLPRGFCCVFMCFWCYVFVFIMLVVFIVFQTFRAGFVVILCVYEVMYLLLLVYCFDCFPDLSCGMRLSRAARTAFRRSRGVLS